MPQGYPTPRAVVLTGTGVFYDNGTTHALHPNLKLDDLSAVLYGATQVFRGGEGVVLLDSPLPAEAPAVVSANWKFTGLRGWTTFVSQSIAVGEKSIIHLGFLPEVAGTGALLHGSDGPRDMAWRLGRYHQLVGLPWRYTAGVTGCAALRNRFTDPDPGRQPLWHFDGPKGLQAGGPIIWKGTEQPDPADGRLVAMFDVNAMYLAALKNVRLAWGKLSQTGPIGFDPEWPGYWQIDTTTLRAELVDGTTRPPLVRHIHKGAGWITTERGKYLTELVGTFDVLDSWTSPNGATIARGYAERLAAARDGALGPMGPCDRAVKRTYAETVGMMAREGGSIHRRDWAVSTMDMGSSNMLRRVDRAHEATGLRPFEIRTDACYYLVERDQIAALSRSLGVGKGPGTFKNPQISTVTNHYAHVGVPA